MPDTTHAPIGILISNLGTPDAPTAPALRRFLKEFLGDPRVVEASRATWWLILNGLILNTRPRHSARLYQRIWTPEGSPLLVISRRITAALTAELARRTRQPLAIELGMRYGQPSIAGALERLRNQGCRRILVLPLYPQYSAATTGSTFDAVANALKGWRVVPQLRFAGDYHDDPAYIAALARSINEAWRTGGEPDRLLISFHGIPKNYAEAGDPYPAQCTVTANRLAAALDLPAGRWQMTFQSRFGRAEWLQPYTDQTLVDWGKQGMRRVDVVCPGFAADCLETLEEMALTNRERFLAAGGRDYRYIPALNARPDHITALAGLVERNLRGWTETDAISGRDPGGGDPASGKAAPRRPIKIPQGGRRWRPL